MDKKSWQCQHCGKCCKCMVLPVQRPLQKSVFLDWLQARGGKVIAEAPDVLYVKIDSICPRLEKSNGRVSCRPYEERPPGCRVFDGSTLDWLDCAWKDPFKYVVTKSLQDMDLIKRGTHSVGFTMKRPHSGKVKRIGTAHKPPFSSDQRKRLSQRRAQRAKEEKADDIRAYGQSMDTHSSRTELPKW
jgi:hypothetical protein